MRFGFWRKSSFKKIQIGGYRCLKLIYNIISQIRLTCQAYYENLAVKIIKINMENMEELHRELMLSQKK